jgi:hypothetical protein
MAFRRRTPENPPAPRRASYQPYRPALRRQVEAEVEVEAIGNPSKGTADMSLDPRTETIHTLANEKCDGCDQRVLLYDRPFADVD